MGDRGEQSEKEMLADIASRGAGRQRTSILADFASRSQGRPPIAGRVFVFSLVGWFLARVLVGMDGSTSSGSARDLWGTALSASLALGGALLGVRRARKNAPSTAGFSQRPALTRLVWLAEFLVVGISMWVLASLIVFFPEIAGGSL